MDKPNSGRAVILLCGGARATYFVASSSQKDVKDYNLVRHGN